MEFADAAQGARRTREQYRALERVRSAREWDLRDLFIGLQGDVGDLAELIGAFEGVRPGPEDLPAAIGHELADVLWSLFCIADATGVDLEAAYAALLDELDTRVRRALDATS